MGDAQERKNTSQSALSVFEIPLNLGSPTEGTKDGPQTLLAAGLMDRLQTHECSIGDRISIAIPEREKLSVGNLRAKYADAIGTVAVSTADIVAPTLRTGSRILALGGDHSLSIGTIAGALAVYKNQLGVIWIDTHGDINTAETTVTGNVHGMPLSVLIGQGHPALVEVVTIPLQPHNLLHIGGHDLDPPEVALYERLQTPIRSMEHIRNEGLGSVFNVIDTLSRKVQKLWVSVDLDAVDAQDAPGVAIPTSGGLRGEELIEVAHYLNRTGKIIGADIVEYVPEKDIDGKTATLAIRCATALFGRI